MRRPVLWALTSFLVVVPTARAQQSEAPDARPLPLTGSEILAAAPDEAWRRPDPENLIVFSLPGGDLVLELNVRFAPRHAANVRRLVRDGHFDGGGVVRSQDNYVAQWTTRKLPENAPRPEILTLGLAAEFERPAEGLAWTMLDDDDPYAPAVGFVDGFAAGHDPVGGTAWPIHCYGAVGVARDTPADSGNGTQLYAVTGHAPRHLDRNLTVVARVISGMPLLSTLPRGTGNLGFFESDDEIVPIRRARVAKDLPAKERPQIELLRTDSDTFNAWIASRRNRVEPFFVQPAGGIGVCNVPLPTR